MSDRICSVGDCSNVVKSRGMCAHHYYANWYHGDPLKGSPRRTPNLPRTADFETRFWSKVEKGIGCWRWLGAVGNGGYGHITRTVDGKRRWFQSHRVAYELHYRTHIPDGMTIDHLCRNPICVRPDHLEVVTQWENNIRNRSAYTKNLLKTHCKRDHPLSGENLRLREGKYGPNRCCKTCDREHAAASRARKRKSA